MKNSTQIKNPIFRQLQYYVDNYTAILTCGIYYIFESSFKYSISELHLQELNCKQDTKTLQGYYKDPEVFKDDFDLMYSVTADKAKEILEDVNFINFINNNTIHLLLGEIEGNLTKNQQQAVAYIKSIRRWMQEAISGTTGYYYNCRPDKYSLVYGVMIDAIMNSYLTDDIIKLYRDFILLCWEFYDSFNIKCSDYGYNTSNSINIGDFQIKESGNNKEASKIFLPQQSNKQAISLKILTPEALKVYNKAIELGYMTKEYKWKLGTSLLAYMTERIYIKDVANTYPDTELCRLFKVRGLKQAIYRLQYNKNGKPRGYKRIDLLFS